MTSEFCVECGKVGPTREGMCRDCYSKRHQIVSAPEFVYATVCNHCGSILVGKGWVRRPLERVIHFILRSAVILREEVDSVQITHDLRYEDERNIDVSAKASLRLGDWEIVQDFHTKVRVRGGSCDVCSKQHARYFEAIVQVRVDGRAIDEDEAREIREIVDDFIQRASERGQAFLSRVEEVRGGLDFYLGSKSLGRTLARELHRRFGGGMISSPKLHGRKGGRDVYRVTHLVRLPYLRAGDVVALGAEYYVIESSGPEIVGLDLRTLSRRRFGPKQLKELRTPPMTKVEGTVVDAKSGLVEVAGRLSEIPKLGDLKEGTLVNLLEIEGKFFLEPSSTRKD